MIELNLFLRKTKQAVSAERLSAYQQSPQESNLTMLSRYFWNVALCEALYPTLQSLEVALRNSMHKSFSTQLGDEWWLHEDMRVIESDDVDYVLQARQRVREKGKPETIDHVVAELPFGFWTALFDSRYEQKLWTKNVKTVFPYVPRQHRFRAALAEDIHKLRKLRNRAFHHEPIWNRNNLRDLYMRSQDLISWINPGLASMNLAMDRFHGVLISGHQPFEDMLKGCAQSFPEDGFDSPYSSDEELPEDQNVNQPEGETP
ncbi:MAG: hypothetical protein L6Q31_05955 [Fimbriimonadaceae bacterium]|nr:hypothetical protein [Fimbriimonadaceae bacterium]NUM38594.1 Abi family protein [Armatimonadota bacterium]